MRCVDIVSTRIVVYTKRGMPRVGSGVRFSGISGSFLVFFLVLANGVSGRFDLSSCRVC